MAINEGYLLAQDSYRGAAGKAFVAINGSNELLFGITKFESNAEIQTGEFKVIGFSIGVAIFSAVNRYLAKIMNGFPQYSVCMQETHHVHKLDAPSGTAITLAEEIIDNIDRKKDWKRGVTYWTEDGHHDEGDANITDEDLVINCVRDGEVPGIHAVMYDSDADMITIEHSAHSRKGFALGAVLAAEFTANHSGLLTTSDLFKF